MSGFFITGTNTEVGKTLITAAIIYQLQEQGVKTCGYKPVVAGMTTIGSRAINEDLETLLLVTNRPQTKDRKLTAQDICPYHLPHPAAPHLVARDAGIPLDLEVMVKSYEVLKKSFEAVMVEGAGGFLVPISETQTLADFAVEIGLPVSLVVDIRLGCINHALLTALAIRHHQLPFAGWVANCTSYPSSYNEENIKTLTNMLKRQFGAELYGIVPFQSEFKAPYTLELIQKVSTQIHL